MTSISDMVLFMQKTATGIMAKKNKAMSLPMGRV